jgi:hypothetical protein
MDIENFMKTIQPSMYKRMVKIPDDVAKTFGLDNFIPFTGEFDYITQLLTPGKDVVLTYNMCNLLGCSPSWQGLSFRDLQHGREKIYSKSQSLPKLQCESLKKAIQIVYATDSANESKILANEVLVKTSELLAKSFRKYFEPAYPIATRPQIKESGKVYIIYQDNKLVCCIKDLQVCTAIVNRLNTVVQSCIDLSDLHNAINKILDLGTIRHTYRPVFKFEPIDLYSIKSKSNMGRMFLK